MLPNKLSFNTIGGELVDYSPITDPTTDLSATADDIARADLAAMTRTIPKAWVLFTVDGYGSIAIANTDYDAVYGNAQIYKPTAVYNGTGDYTFTFPASIVDVRGITQLVNLTYGKGNIESPGFTIHAKKLSANQFSVLIWNGGPADPTFDTDKCLLEVT